MFNVIFSLLNFRSHWSKWGHTSHLAQRFRNRWPTAQSLCQWSPPHNPSPGKHLHLHVHFHTKTLVTEQSKSSRDAPVSQSTWLGHILTRTAFLCLSSKEHPIPHDSSETRSYDSRLSEALVSFWNKPVWNDMDPGRAGFSRDAFFSLDLNADILRSRDVKLMSDSCRQTLDGLGKGTW